MASYDGPLLRGGKASKWIAENAINTQEVGPGRAFNALRLIMGAFPAFAFPICERAARYARIAQMHYDDARLVLTAVDQVIDPAEFPEVSAFDRDLAGFYADDGGKSGVGRSLPIIVACMQKRCAFCLHYLPPASEGLGLPLNTQYLHQSIENCTRAFSTEGNGLCFEFVRTCPACQAVHHTSHATRKSIGEVPDRRARSWADVRILRVHSGIYVDAELIDRSLKQYHFAFVPNYSAAHMIVRSALRDKNTEHINPDILLRACTIRSILFWRQEVGRLAPEDDDVWFLFSSEPTLRYHLRFETRDINFDDQGLYPKLMKRQSILHGHLGGPYAGCDQIAQDGNFDARYKVKEMDDQPPPDDVYPEEEDEELGIMENSDEPPHADEEEEEPDDGEPEEFNLSLHVPDEIDEAGTVVGDSGDANIQMTHPKNRRRVQMSVARLIDLKPGGRALSAGALMVQLGATTLADVLDGAVTLGTHCSKKDGQFKRFCVCFFSLTNPK